MSSSAEAFTAPHSAFAYEAYIYQLHCSSFPTDHIEALEVYGSSPVDTAYAIEKIRTRGELTLSRMLFQQLQFTTTRGMNELHMPIHTVEIANNQDKMSQLQDHLRHIGRTVMDNFYDHGLYAKNEGLQRLTNPLESIDLVTCLVVNHADTRRQQGSADRFLNLANLAPGYSKTNG